MKPIRITKGGYDRPNTVAELHLFLDKVNAKTQAWVTKYPLLEVEVTVSNKIDGKGRLRHTVLTGQYSTWAKDWPVDAEHATQNLADFSGDWPVSEDTVYVDVTINPKGFAAPKHWQEDTRIIKPKPKTDGKIVSNPINFQDIDWVKFAEMLKSVNKTK